MKYNQENTLIFRYLKLGFIISVFTISKTFAQKSVEKNYSDLVNTTIGSKGKGHGVHEQYLEAGYTFPGAMYPMGMVQFTNTFFAENKGFVVNQLSGAGCDHMGNFPIMPLAGALKDSPNDMKSFKPGFKIEKAVAGLYRVKLTKDDINANLTVTQRTGMATFEFAKSEQQATLVIGSGINATQISEASVKITGNNSLEGYADGGSFCGSATPYKVYYVAVFDQPVKSAGTWKDGVLKPDSKGEQGPNSGAFFTFNVSKQKTIKYKFAISYVSIANAYQNLKAENPDWNFEAIKVKAQQAWNNKFSRIKVVSKDADHVTQFYTHLYHVFTHPNISNDVNGQYMGADDKVHVVSKGRDNYTSFSNWDTYRTQIQLIAMLAPKQTSQIIQSTINFAEQSGGSLPRWVLANTETGIMQGDPTAIVIANAYAFGATDFDTQKALKIMKRGAEVPGAKSQTIETRPHVAQYLQKGYVNDASMTLEYTSADFAIGMFAKKALNDQTTYQKYLERSTWWKNQFDRESGWIRSKESDGSWRGQNDGMREANYKSYFWMVPYNVKGLIDIIGGNKNAEERLDNFFRKLNADYSQDWFAAGNEPDFQVPWLYNWVGAPYKTQALVKKILQEQYSNKDNGLPGNDDLGAMGAFYVFGNIGLFPVIPGVGGVSINSPSFSSIIITLPNGKNLSITGGNKDLNYIQSVKFQGKVLNQTWLNWKQLSMGGKLEYKLSDKPNKSWGLASPPPSYQ
ncbi:GH92 family glycosyl hydrolase [Pedobacter sandarakinus]|uniref:GH92 family glycosyl hydrolase n=1 Tax=Pedobacter sandarakinus TaxID=353156 RepID=UPI0022457B2D|nr:GH92 family glycosyl hydrolase [Pedobacter sandarakinus]MCX2574116.1 GH92 family glycosyl hydrolase [Pedobacter sandarakinus]